LIKKKNKIVSAIQVTKELNDENTKREINGLVEALEKYHLKKGVILTFNEDEKEERINGKKIRFIPLWKWLLE
jgi:hypothetical protein